LFWAFEFGSRWLELPMFPRFLSALAACGLLTLLFTVWWFARRGVRLTDRLLVFGFAVAGGVLAALLSPTMVGVIAWLLLTLPFVFTAWALCLVVAHRASPRTRRVGLLVTIGLTWAAFTLIRMEGLTGEGKTVIRWRWTPTAEELYLAERTQRGGRAARAVPGLPSSGTLALAPGDWPGFRGPGRDGVVRGVKIATDWQADPPRLLWRQRVGPGWSSLAVVGDRLFTQEQREGSEAVVCLDAATGREIWAHVYPARWQDAQSGAGPRATPTFADGRIYALGATGILNCLDVATGQLKWTHDIAAESGARPPIWGFTSSPLVVKGVVIVFAGGEGTRGLLAYRAESGKLAWTAPAGRASYSSPQPASIGGKDQVLFFDERGLSALDPTSGAVLWEHSAPGSGMPRSLQPHPVGSNQVLLASEAELGTALIEVTGDGPSRQTDRRWTSRHLKPSFNDFAVHGEAVYGFDGGVFCCIDLKSGKRRWKEGRYGHGQLLLLADQSLLLVVSEEGEAALLAANPDRHEELGRLQAVNGKTWNHPVLAHGRLYIRNAEEMACYELKLAGSH
jgi:outer membrane protein assembly factor BamB